MSDIIDELDRLHDTIEGFPKRSTIEELARAIERRGEIVNEHWPAISARLREAERKAAAWDAIAGGHIHREDDGFTFSGFIGKDSSWGRTIKAALAAKETKQ